jgi:hypothetical protein
MNKTELVALRVLARRGEWSVDELPPLLSPDILRCLDSAGLVQAQQVLVRDMRDSEAAPPKPIVMPECWRSPVQHDESWDAIFVHAARDYWHWPYRVRITERGSAELSRRLKSLREDPSERTRLTDELAGIATGFERAADDALRLSSHAEEQAFLMRFDGRTATLGQCIAECHELWRIPECATPFANWIAPERMVETELDAVGPLHAEFAQDTLAEMSRSEPSRLRLPDLLTHEAATLIGPSDEAVRARSRRSSHARAFGELARIVRQRIQPMTERHLARSASGEEVEKYLPIGAFPKKIKSRIELAARETATGKRESMRVRREKIAGSWRYCKSDVRRNWPLDTDEMEAK